MKTVILGTAHTKDVLGKGSPDGRIKEYKYSRELCKTIKPILEDLGYKTFIDVEDDSISDELKTRCKIVNELHKKYKNCIYISIHLNAAGSDGKWHTGTGWEIYTSPGKTEADHLAKCLYESAKKNLPNVKFRTDFSDGDPDKEANLYVLKNTNCPAVLTENMFLDNKDDVEFLLSDEGFHKIVRLHVEGIINYIKDNS